MQETTTPTVDTGFPTAESMSGRSSAANGPDGNPGRVQDLVQRAAEGAHQTVDKLADKAIPAAEKLTTAIDSASASAQQSAKDLENWQRGLTESLRNTVREHPLTAVAAALALGVLISNMNLRA
jgi:hypothetical protein